MVAALDTVESVDSATRWWAPHSYRTPDYPGPHMGTGDVDDEGINVEELSF
jgi:hypothetical protein